MARGAKHAVHRLGELLVPCLLRVLGFRLASIHRHRVPSAFLTFILPESSRTNAKKFTESPVRRMALYLCALFFYNFERSKTVNNP